MSSGALSNWTYLRPKLFATVRPSVHVESLAGEDVRRAHQKNDLIDLPRSRSGVLLRRRGDLPDRAVRRLDDAAVAPERFRDCFDRGRSGVERGADECVDRGGLRHHERQGEPTEAGGGRGRGRSRQAQLIVQAEGVGIEGRGCPGVGDFERDGADGSRGADGCHGNSFRKCEHVGRVVDRTCTRVPVF